MREADLQPFSELLDAVCGLLSRGTYTPSAANAALWFRALAAHELDVVRAGFDAHVRDPQRGRFVPTPADILGQIEGASADERPGPEEAWAICRPGFDENATIVWTEEMRTAWRAALPLMEAGQEIAARMSFRECYEALVNAARRERRAVRWEASLGRTAELREPALAEAAERGRLPAPERTLIAGPQQTLETLETLASAAPAHVRDRLIAQLERIRSKPRDPKAWMRELGTRENLSPIQAMALASAEHPVEAGSINSACGVISDDQLPPAMRKQQPKIVDCWDPPPDHFDEDSR